MVRTTRARAEVDRPLARAMGARIRAARLRAGLTQAALADGRYTKAYISALENGLSKPSLAALNYLAERLGVTPGDLLGERGALWARVEADLRLAAGDWQTASDAYASLLDQEPEPRRRAELLRGQAEAASRLDLPELAVRAGSEAAALFGAQGRNAEAALARYWQASGLYRLENAEEARSLLRGLLDEIRHGLAVEPDLEMRILIGLAMIDSREGEPRRALSYLDEARGRLGELDDRRRAAFLESLAISYRESGDLEGAVSAATQSIAYFRAAEDEFEVAILDNELALTYLALGTLDRAREHALAARRRLEALDDRTRLANVLETEAQVALAADDLAAAEASAQAATAAALETGNHKAAVSATLTRARIARRSGDRDAAIARYEEAVERAREHGRAAQLREALVELSDLVAENGDTERAYHLAREALR